MKETMLKKEFKIEDLKNVPAVKALNGRKYIVGEDTVTVNNDPPMGMVLELMKNQVIKDAEGYTLKQSAKTGMFFWVKIVKEESK